MTTDRRSDIGSKIGWAVLFGIISFLLGILFQQSHGIAVAALAKANEVELKETKIEQCMVTSTEDLREIKGDMKKVLEHVARENQNLKNERQSLS